MIVTRGNAALPGVPSPVPYEDNKPSDNVFYPIRGRPDREERA